MHGIFDVFQYRWYQFEQLTFGQSFVLLVAVLVLIRVILGRPERS